MRNNKNISKVSIIMGSQSDYSTMKFCEKVLKILKISFEKKIISAHGLLKECLNMLEMLRKIISL